MKKVIALALSLIMVLAMGVTSFAITMVEPSGGDTTVDWGFSWINPDWDIDNENLVIAPYDIGDAGTLLDGTDTANALFGADYVPGDTLSSIKVDSEKGIVDVTVYKLDDYVKSLDLTNPLEPVVKTKSTWPFEDFDLQDLVDVAMDDPDASPFSADNKDLDLFFIYFDIPTYGGAKLSTDNYFTLKFRENTTGADLVETSEKVWFCIYPWIVEEGDVETYADEDEAMELADGVPMIEDLYDDVYDLIDDLYEDVPHANAADLEDYVMYIDETTVDELVAEDILDLDKTPYIITKDTWKEIVGSTLIVGVNDDLEVEIGKIVKGQTGISFAVDTDVDDDVQAINEDAELAALLFLDTTNVLDSDFVVTYTFEIEDAAKAGDYFLYELVGDELTLVKKVAVGKGDDEVEVEIERKAGDTLGQYYLSDVELATATAEEGNEENPNTGASEVAGVAVALAVISLVSAAAVSLKK